MSLPNSVKPKNVVVYGGGVNIKFARDVIRNACKGMMSYLWTATRHCLAVQN